jgi:predicted SAM-dependent methyltransferase
MDNKMTQNGRNTSQLQRLLKHQRSAYYFLCSIPNRLRLSNSRLIKEHLSLTSPKKLHLGCGYNILSGWLNTDLNSSATVAYLDVTRRFPFGCCIFDYVFSEHVIEHIEYEHGLAMLQESYRVLRPGGKIRIVTPDFAFLEALHGCEKTELQKAYIEWAAETWLDREIPQHAEMHVINNFVRAWGHQFIYDRTSLSQALVSAGFSQVRTCELLSSEDNVFCNLENENRLPPGFLRLESLVLEGTKASDVN